MTNVEIIAKISPSKLDDLRQRLANDSDVADNIINKMTAREIVAEWGFWHGNGLADTLLSFYETLVAEKQENAPFTRRFDFDWENAIVTVQENRIPVATYAITIHKNSRGVQYISGENKYTSQIMDLLSQYLDMQKGYLWVKNGE